MQSLEKIMLIVFSLAIVCLIVSLAGCSGLPLQKTDRDVALAIALNDPEISGEIAVSKGDYQASAEPIDVAEYGFLNVTGTFYRVSIDTAKLDPLPYMAHYIVLVDVLGHKELLVQSQFDVMQAPYRILIPSYGTWYTNLYPSRIVSLSPEQNYPSEQHFSIYPYPKPSNVTYLLMDPFNFTRYMTGQPYGALNLSDFQTAFKTTDSISYPWYSGVTVNASKSMLNPTSTDCGLYVSLSYDDIARSFYLVVANNGQEDRSINCSITAIAG